MAPDGFRGDFLQIAARYGQSAIISYLLGTGMDSGRYSYDLPLVLAAENGHLDALKVLLSRNPALISYVDSGGRSAFLASCSTARTDVIAFLLAATRNIHEMDQEGRSALLIAAEAGQLQSMDFLLSHGFDTNIRPGGRSVLHYACKGGHFAVFEYLQARNLHFTDVDDFGQNCLHYAVMGGHQSVVAYIVDQHLVSAYSTTLDGRTALHVALENGKMRCAKLLQKAGLSVHSRLPDGRNALHLVCSKTLTRDQDLAIQFLLKEGLWIDARDLYERTPLHYVAHPVNIN